jgi:hypothetical protein
VCSWQLISVHLPLAYRWMLSGRLRIRVAALGDLLGAPVGGMDALVSKHYADRRPFAFTGRIDARVYRRTTTKRPAHVMPADPSSARPDVTKPICLDWLWVRPPF